MGVLNLTPDSFYDGGRFADQESAVGHGIAMFEAGAQIVDVGGESTRPGAARVASEEELRRVLPVIEGLRRRCAGLVCVDTTRAEVAGRALEAGADLVNDVSGLGFEAGMAPLLAASGAAVVVGHLRGGFQGMHGGQVYGDVAGEVAAELAGRLAGAEAAGIRREQTIVDPGLGFSKDAAQSLAVLGRLSALESLDRPILVGPSRKSFLGRVLGLPTGERLLGTAAAVAAAVLGGAHLVRVHDVAEMAQVVRVCDAILEAA